MNKTYFQVYFIYGKHTMKKIFRWCNNQTLFYIITITNNKTSSFDITYRMLKCPLQWKLQVSNTNYFSIRYNASIGVAIGYKTNLSCIQAFSSTCFTSVYTLNKIHVPNIRNVVICPSNILCKYASESGTTRLY